MLLLNKRNKYNLFFDYVYNRIEILLNKKMIFKNIIDYLIFIRGGGIFYRFYLFLNCKKKFFDI